MLKSQHHTVPPGLRYLFKLWLTAIVTYQALRMVFILLTLGMATEPAKHATTIAQAFAVGLRFDVAVAGYLLSIPFIIAFLSYTFNLQSKAIRASHYIALFLLGISFFVCCADVPYYKYFSERLNGFIFSMEDAAIPMLKVILSDWRYYVYLLLFVVFMFLFYRVAKVYCITWEKTVATQPNRTAIGVLLFVLIIPLLAISMRGRTDALSPLRSGTAFFSDYVYANKLALNPVFSFVEGTVTHFEQRKHALNVSNADTEIDLTRQILGVQGKPLYGSPLCRSVEYDAEARPLNVVIILMESMAAGNMQRHGNKNNLTPFLDSLAKRSLVFDNFYSSGTHTQHGVYSTLTGYPCLPHQHSLIRPGTESYESIAHIVRKNGYATSFYTSHDAQLDNIGGFCKSNGFQHVYSDADYPTAQRINAWGIPDHHLFNFALNKMDEQHALHKPFFNTILTISNHPPYAIPKDVSFKPKAKTEQDRAVEYADFAMEQFFAEASTKPWFANTLFVLVADHGRWVGDNPYEFALSFVHVPMLMFCPKYIQPEVSFNFGGQVDVQETILGVLQLPHYNNTFGVDLRRTPKPFAFFCSDDKLGYIDERWFYYNRITKDNYLYSYRDNNLTNYASDSTHLTQRASTQLNALFKTAQWMVQNGKITLTKAP